MLVRGSFKTNIRAEICESISNTDPNTKTNMCIGAAAMIQAVVRNVKLFTLSDEGLNFSEETVAYVFSLLTYSMEQCPS